MGNDWNPENVILGQVVIQSYLLQELHNKQVYSKSICFSIFQGMDDWAIAFFIRTPPVEDTWNSKGGGTLS